MFAVVVAAVATVIAAAVTTVAAVAAVATSGGASSGTSAEGRELDSMGGTASDLSWHDVRDMPPAELAELVS